MRKVLQTRDVQPRDGRPHRAGDLPAHHGTGQHVHVGVLFQRAGGKPDDIEAMKPVLYDIVRRSLKAEK